MSIPSGAQICPLGLLICTTLASGFALDVRTVRFRRDSAASNSPFFGFNESSLPEPNSEPPLGTELGSPSKSAAEQLLQREEQALLLADDGSRSAHQGVYLWIKDTFKFIIGSVLVLVSVSALAFFERHRARVDCLFCTARSSCESVSGFKAQAEAGCLVHVTGAQTRPTAPVRDPRFKGVTLQEGCVRLRTAVQVYQSVERPPGDKFPIGASKNVKGSSGGSSAWEGWSEVDMGIFSQDGLRNSAAPAGLRIGTTVTNCGRVELGTKFALPDALVDQCRKFQPADHLLESPVTTLDGKLAFHKHEDGYFYCRHGSSGWGPREVAEAPRVGDARVRFEHVAPGPVTVIALQADFEGTSNDGKMTFAPYRLVSRGICGLGEEEERAALLAESKKSRGELAHEDQCLPGSRLCCGCNLMARCFTGFLTPEIFRLFEGTRRAEDCFSELVPPVGWSPWVVRFLLYMTLTTGYCLAAYAVAIAVPWPKSLPLKDDLGTWTRLCYSFFCTLLTGSAIISSAYLTFRPVFVFSCLLVVAAVVLVPNVWAMYTNGSVVLLQPPPELDGSAWRGLQPFLGR